MTTLSSPATGLAVAVPVPVGLGIETQYRPTLDQIASSEGVTGLLVADLNGLCIASRGVLKSGCSGAVSALMESAVALAEQENESPIILIQTEKTSFLIAQNQGLTTAITKKTI